jgi:hypothetical protein
MPAQVVAQRGPLRDEPFAVIDEQSDVEFWAGQLRDWQGVEAFAQRGAGDRDGIDEVRFARFARRLACAGGQLGRDAHDGFASGEQEPLERAGDVPAVLDRPHAFGAVAARPREQDIEGPLAGRDGALAEYAPRRRLDRGDGVRTLMRVRPDHDHDPCPFRSVGVLKGGSPADTSQSRPKATHLSSHAGDPRTAASDITSAGQTRPVDRKSMSQPVAGPRTYRPRRTPPPDHRDSGTEKVKCG